MGPKRKSAENRSAKIGASPKTRQRIRLENNQHYHHPKKTQIRRPIHRNNGLIQAPIPPHLFRAPKLRRPLLQLANRPNGLLRADPNAALRATTPPAPKTAINGNDRVKKKTSPKTRGSKTQTPTPKGDPTGLPKNPAKIHAQTESPPKTGQHKGENDRRPAIRRIRHHQRQPKPNLHRPRRLRYFPPGKN